MDGNEPAGQPEGAPQSGSESFGVPTAGADGDYDRIHARVWDVAFAVASERAEPHDAADVAQDVTLAFSNKWHAGTFRHKTDGLLDVWVARATRFQLLHLVRDGLRREDHEYVYDFEDEAAVAIIDGQVQGYSPSDAYNAEELVEVVRRGTNALPRRLHDVYRGVRERHQRYDEIATELHISEVTVRRHYQMACERLYAIAMGYVTDGLIPEAK